MCIDLDRFKRKDALLVRANPGPSQYRLDPQDQLLYGKGFRDVVVCAELEPLHDVFIGGFCRQHDDRLQTIGLSNAIANGVAVDTRQHDVQKDEVELPG